MSASPTPRWLTPILATLGLLAGAATITLLPSSVLFVSEISNPEISNPSSSSPASASSASLATPSAPARWACPMMDFIAQKPGDCPVCGMKMTKVTAGELTAEQQRRMGLETTVLRTGPAVATVHAYGTVRYDDRTLQLVLPRVAGRIVKRHPAALHPGTLVPVGAPVVDLYSPEVFAAQGELAAALRLPDGHSLHALTERFIRWNLLPVATAILQGGAPVDTITITTPYAGLVTTNVGLDSSATINGMAAAKLPSVGQEIMADTPLLRLVEPHTFMVVVHVPEARAHWLRPGQPVALSSDDRGPLPDVAATVSWVSPELNPEIRSREIHLHLSDPASRLLPGSLVHARIQISLTAADLGLPAATSPSSSTSAPLTSALLIPKTAVLSTGVRHVAWRVSARSPDGRLTFALAPLALGPRLESATGEDVYVVRAGLAPGDEVATQAAFLIDAQAQLAGTPSLLHP